MKVLDHGFVELVSKTGHVGASVVDSARCSFGSKGDDLGERDRKLIASLLGNGHSSPFRHAYFTFHVKAPLFVFRQWWKHQVGSSFREYENAEGEPVAFDIMSDTDKGCSWNELSGRYKVMEPEFYIPKVARSNGGGNKQSSTDADKLTGLMRIHMTTAQQQAVHSYHLMLENGVAKELARLVLPPSIYSECYWTVSLQAVLHFLKQRLDPHAQWEMRQYAQGILELIREDLEKMGISHAPEPKVNTPETGTITGRLQR